MTLTERIVTSSSTPNEPPKRKKTPPTAKKLSRPSHMRWSVPLGWVVLATLLFGSWELMVVSGVANPIYFGQPSRILQSLVTNLFGDLLFVHTVSTFTGVLLGWGLASILGVVLALALSTSPYMMRVIDPFFTALNSLPRVALAPLFLIWFGIGLEPKIALAFSLAFFVVFANTLAGVESANADHKLLARVLGASKFQTFRRFVLPGAVPSIFTGLELGFIFGVLATVAGEMLAGQSGLGVQLQYLANTFRMHDYFATLIVLVVVTMIFSAILRMIRKRLLRWQASEVTK